MHVGRALFNGKVVKEDGACENDACDLSGTVQSPKNSGDLAIPGRGQGLTACFLMSIDAGIAMLFSWSSLEGLGHRSLLPDSDSVPLLLRSCECSFLDLSKWL